MIIFIDTNIIISAVLNPNGTPQKAYDKATSLPHQGIISQQTVDELVRIFRDKFPKQQQKLYNFLINSLPSLEIISVPKTPIVEEVNIRDLSDRPILRAATKAKADIILTGDKDFLESGITSPRIMTASEFLNL